MAQHVTHILSSCSCNLYC